MGRYNFVSGGAAAGDAISAFLMQREMQARQDMLARLKQQQEANDVAQQEKNRALREQEIALQREQEARVAAAQKASLDDLANQREYAQVSGAVEGARPDDAPLDPEMAAKVQRQGFGSRLRQVPGVLMQGPMESGDQMSEADRESDPTLGRTPEQQALRPGSKYLDAEAQRTFLEGQAQDRIAAEKSRAEERAATEKMIAQMRIDAAKGNADIGNYLKMLQAEVLKGKIDDTAKSRTDAAGAVASGRAQVRDLASGLLSDPNLDAISGPVAGRTMDVRPDSVDAAARLKQLVNMLSLESRGKMKGQGQISDFEGRMLASAVSAIDRTAGTANVKKHLQEIVDAFAGDAPNAGAAAGGGGAGGFAVVSKRPAR